MTMLPALNTIGMRDGSEAAFGKSYNVLPIWKDRMDSRAWVPLDKAQEMLHAKGLIKDKNVISAIWGLKCGVECDLENLAKIRKFVDNQFYKVK